MLAVAIYLLLPQVAGKLKTKMSDIATLAHVIKGSHLPLHRNTLNLEQLPILYLPPGPWFQCSVQAKKTLSTTAVVRSRPSPDSSSMKILTEPCMLHGQQLDTLVMSDMGKGKVVLVWNNKGDGEKREQSGLGSYLVCQIYTYLLPTVCMLAV